MSTMTKPLIVLVPGAWHSPEHYGPLVKHLHAAGYETDAVMLPSYGGELANWDPDVEAIRQSITKAVDAGKDVFLVAHSYGGFPAQEACRGLDKATLEAQGKSGGIIRLCWLCAFLGDEGQSLMGYLGGQDLPWWRREEGVSARRHSPRRGTADVLLAGQDTLRVHALDAKNICYNDLSDDEVAHWSSLLKHHSYQTFSSQTTYPAWKHIPATYLLCENDHAIPIAMQEKMVNEVGQGKWTTERCKCSHSPFLSEPEFTSQVIRRAAGEQM